MNASTEQAPILFDDFLGLNGESFRRTRLIVFTGSSGSGKSTALKFLCDQHPAFSGGPMEWIWTLGKTWDPPRVSGKRLVVVDEVSPPRQLPAVTRLLRQKQTVAVASHLRPSWFLPFSLAWRTLHFRTDRDRPKISRYLSRLGVPHSANAVAEFCRLYGSSYVDLDCILERYPGRSLDQALHLTLKLDRLTTMRVDEWTPVMPIILTGPQEEPHEPDPSFSRLGKSGKDSIEANDLLELHPQRSKTRE